MELLQASRGGKITMMPLELTDRKQMLRMAANPPAAVRQRIASAADELNRVGLMAMRVELVNEALCKFATMLYEKDADGAFANIDSPTGRLLVSAPWGSSGWKRWGLRNWEARVLRSVLLSRLQAKPLPLFDYGNQTWYLNRGHYRTVGMAHAYLEVAPVALSEWRKYAKKCAEGEATRKRKSVTNPV
jgi:hypothetical protein